MISCNYERENINKLDDFSEEIILKGDRLGISDKLTRSFELLIIKNYLIISDPSSTSLFKLVDLNSENSIYEFGEIGDGPCEFQFPSSIQVISEKNGNIGIFNRKTWKYQEMEFKIVNDTFYWECTSDLSKSFDTNFQKIIKINNTVFIGVGIFKTKYATSIINSGEIEELPIEYPFSNGVPNNGEIAMSQQGDLILQPNGNKILVTSKHSPFFDILEYESEKIKLLERFEGWAPKRIMNSDANTFAANLETTNKFGFISSSSTENFIYLLFSGKDFSNDPYSSNIVLKYDWKGRGISKYLLDNQVNQIAVSPDDKFLITYHDDGKPNFIRYELDIE